MGFSKISELRDLLVAIPPGVLTPTQRFALMVINSYTKDGDPEGACWIGQETFSRMLGITPRGLGYVLRSLREKGLIRRHVKKARIGQQQSYSIKWQTLRRLASMNSSSPSDSESMNLDVLEGELQTFDEGTQVPPYRDNKHNRNLSNDYYLKQILEQIPRDKRGKVSNLSTLDDLISKYASKGGRRQYLVELAGLTDYGRINSPGRFLESKFSEEVEKFTPTPTPPRFSAEDDR